MILPAGVPSFLQNNAALYAGIIQLYKRGTVRILEESADGVFVQDTLGIASLTCLHRPICGLQRNG